MSIKVIESQVARFLQREVPEVISIKGAWGVGKTYAWNSYLSKARHQKKIGLLRYSYVSLFGINSLKDLKFAIFENMVDLSTLGRKSTVESFRNNIADLLSQLGKKSLPLFSSNALVSHYHSMLDSLSFLALDKTIICIDDFERKGNSIEAQDILGLISQLKEQKRCKVVLILNDESLREDSSIDYGRLREKVIDTELRFDPTPEDCVQIALKQDRVAKLLGENIIKLGINNIRIIKKIEKLAEVLVPQLADYDQLVLSQALRTLTLLTWCYYGPASQVPDYSFVLSRKRLFVDPEEELSLTTQQQDWRALLRNYGDYAVDGFDLQVARLVEYGYLDEKGVQTEARLLNEKISADRSENSFQEAWRKFNHSFDNNSKEVIDCLSQSFKDGARHISPANLDGTVRLLRNLGKNRLATRIIDLYIQKRGQERELFNLDSAALAGEIKDQEVVERFKEKQREFRAERSLTAICEQLLSNTGPVDEEGEKQLAQSSVEEFVALFKTLKGEKLSQHIDLCLKYGRLGGTTEYQSEIAEKAIAALKRIGAESKLNASRVRRFGVTLNS